MTIHPSALLTIALMAIVTYLCRAGGYWLMGRVAISPRIEAGLAYLPGAVLIALVAPATVEEGAPGLLAVGATAAVMRWRGNLFLALVAGVGTIWIARRLIG